MLYTEAVTGGSNVTAVTANSQEAKKPRRKRSPCVVGYLDQVGKPVLVFGRTAAIGRVLPVQVQSVKAT